MVVVVLASITLILSAAADASEVASVLDDPAIGSWSCSQAEIDDPALAQSAGESELARVTGETDLTVRLEEFPDADQSAVLVWSCR
jgi:hypothetical protein